MSNIKSESLSWVDQLETLRALGPNASRADRKKALKVGNTQITYLVSFETCFDQAAIAKVRRASQATPPYILSFTSARTLVGLKKSKVSDLPGSVHAALDVILSLHLAKKKIKNLVDWMVSGKPASEFDPKYKPKKSPVEPAESEDSEEESENSIKSNSDSPDAKSAGIKAGKNKKDQSSEEGGLSINATSSSMGTGTAKSHASAGGLSISETMFDDWLADIPVIQQIKSKVRKGKPITRGERSLLWIHKGGELAGHLIRFALRMIKLFFKIIHWVWKLVIDVLKEIGLYKYAKAVFVFGTVFIACWFVWEALHYGLVRPVEFIWSKIHHEQTVASDPTPVPTPLTGTGQPEVTKLLSFANTAMLHLKPKPTPIPTPLIAYKPSVTFKTTDFDPKLLEQEIAAIPADSLIKDYVFQPDEGMPVDLAVGRLQNLTDADKYTMMIGSGKQKILSFSPSNTNFIITYKSTDLFNVFGDGSGTMTFFWEDVLYIHINEIDHFYSKTGQPDIKYQCTWVVKGAKYPLIIQCGSKDDLENLVSAMEYFIRHTRLSPKGGLGHDAQPAGLSPILIGGMPYFCQGLRLTGQNQIEKLWAGSPMDKAGLKLGNVIWSLDKNTQYQQDRKTLEKELETLTPGPHTLYMVNPADLAQAQSDVSFHRANLLNPKRYQVQIVGN